MCVCVCVWGGGGGGGPGPEILKMAVGLTAETSNV